MAGIVGLAVLMYSLSVNKANVYNQSARRIGKLGADSLCSNPGEIFRGQACERCYCDDKKTAICGPAGTCTLSDKVPNKAELVSLFNKKTLASLNKLPSTASKCVPGRFYRVACNRCICDANASLDCETLLCPSIADVKRLKVKTMSGKPCVHGDIIKSDCVECKCKKRKYACVSLKDCVPAVALKLEEEKCLQGKKNHHSCPVRLDREATSQPLLELDPAFGSAVPIQKAFLDPISPKKCTPGVIYSKGSCNKCTCSDNNVLRCTSMSCISSALLKRWRALKRPARPERPKTKRPKPDKKKVTDKDGDILKVKPEVHLYPSFPVRLDSETTSQPFLKLDPAFGSAVPIQKAFLNPKSSKKCTPRVIYSKGSCNKCTCSDNNVLRCTSMSCISSALLKRWRALKRPARPQRPKTKRPKPDKKKVTDKDGDILKVKPEGHLYPSEHEPSSSDDTFESGEETSLKGPKRPKKTKRPKRT